MSKMNRMIRCGVKFLPDGIARKLGFIPEIKPIVSYRSQYSLLNIFKTLKETSDIIKKK